MVGRKCKRCKIKGYKGLEAVGTPTASLKKARYKLHGFIPEFTPFPAKSMRKTENF